MALFLFIINQLSALHIPFTVYEDMSFNIMGNVPPVLAHMIDHWYRINDLIVAQLRG